MVEGGGCSGFQVYAHPNTYKVCKNIFYIERPPGMYGVQKNFKFASVVFNGVLGPLLDEGEGHEVLLRLSAFTNIVKVIFFPCRVQIVK